MRLNLLGVRGSTPAPGPEFVRYGGHTSCVAVSKDDASSPSLVLDAGTGLRSLTSMLEGRAFQGSIVVSHLHWDHVQGLPFFVAGDRPEAKVSFYAPGQDGLSGRNLLARMMAPPIFPIAPEGLHGVWHFYALEPGTSEIEGFTVTAADVAHKGGRTFGFRVEDGRSSFAYLPDHIASAGLSEAGQALVQGVDVLLHDAQFLEAERPFADDYGHSTVEDAIGIADTYGVKRLVLFHHGPARTDEALDTIAATFESPSVTVAVQGETIELAFRP